LTLALEAQSQDYPGYELTEDRLTVNCQLVKDWGMFNIIDFSLVRHLWIYGLRRNDTINFQNFTSITELRLEHVRCPNTLHIASSFPKLQSLSVESKVRSNISYEGIQNLESLTELSIQDHNFFKTCDLSGFVRLRFLEIMDRSSLSYIEEHVTSILPNQLEYLGIICRSKRATNSFLRAYFRHLSCRNLYVIGRGVELDKDYEFQTLHTNQLPPWVLIETDISEYIQLSKYFIVDVAASIGFRGCPTITEDWDTLDRLNFYLLNDRFKTECTSFPYKRMDMNSWIEFIN
jgi:hypothetical protein